MPTVRKPKAISQPFSAAEIAAAKAAALPVAQDDTPPVDWSKGVVTHGGGANATIREIHRARVLNANSTKEQVAIRLDKEVLEAFRAGGPGWQTRMNLALREWLASHPAANSS